MNIRKIAAFGAAVIMAAGIVTGVPMSTENGSLLAVTAEAADNGFVIETDRNGNKYVSGYNGKGGDITIPDGVVYINDEAFGSSYDSSKVNKTITSVIFPKSCIFVDQNAFTNCSSLKTVIFNGDASIASNAFRECISLESVTIKGSLCKKFTPGVSGGIDNGAFSNCVSLKTVKIEKMITNLTLETVHLRAVFHYHL